MFVFDFQNKIRVAFFLFFTKVQMKIHFDKIFLGTTLFLISKTGGLVYFHLLTKDPLKNNATLQ